GDLYPAFFAVVPPGENPVGYAKLARHMGPNHTFYKLQAAGPALVDRPYTEEEMQTLAEEYVEAMRNVQPVGPYYFGGMCDGAHIALRMAQRVDSVGEKVGMLSVFDTWVLENSQRPIAWLIHYYAQRLQELRKKTLSDKLNIGVRAFRKYAKKIFRPSVE